jgi:hypothetical protein
MRVPAFSFLLAACCSLLIAACESSDDLPLPPPETDEIPPAMITDLSVASRDAQSVVLRWSAPGDDGSTGVAWRYDLRHSDAPITPESWSGSTQVGGEPTPGFAGWQQVFEVIHLEEGRTYYFAIRAFDDHSNVSPISNVLEVVPGSDDDSDPPSVITDLAAETAGPGAIRLTWTAPRDDGSEDGGDDGGSGNDTDDATGAGDGGDGAAWGYEIRHSRTPLDPTNFLTARALSETPIPQSPGEEESFEVTGLEPGVVYHFGMRAWDEASNSSPPSNFVSAAAGGAASSMR